MTRKILRRVYIGQKGFTLVEMLIVIAILAVLVALVVPNMVKYVDSADNAAQKTEFAMMQHSVSAAMADAGVDQITDAPVNFGNTSHTSPPSPTDLVIGSAHLGDYISGGLTDCQGEYQVTADGTVSLVWYP